MKIDPRTALDQLIAALEEHLVASQKRRGEMDPAVQVAYQQLADAFDAYDEALYQAYHETTPFVLYDEDDDLEDDDLEEGDLAGDDLDDDLEDYEFETSRPDDASSKA